MFKLSAIVAWGNLGEIRKVEGLMGFHFFDLSRFAVTPRGGVTGRPLLITLYDGNFFLSAG